jgi:tRNA (adenine37-N6)-methyltransferase
MINMEPIGIVHNRRVDADDDFWGGAEATITLTDAVEPDAFDGIETFSHVEVIFYFHRVPPEQIVRGARHPRSNPAWPKVGIFAQRGKNRPNQIGSTIARVVRRDGPVLVVAELDAIDGTPVLDVKPVMREFLPRAAVTQPAWATELMRQYWALGEPTP